MSLRRSPALLLISLAVVVTLEAHDRWEFASFTNDDGSFTHNELRPGEVQQGHDLQAPDQDWYVFRGAARHSYEAIVGSGTALWTIPACSGCATFDRVDVNGNVLTAGLADGAVTTIQPASLAVRFIDSVGTNQFLRAVAQSNFSAVDTYDIRLHDTTYLLPRFNNSATQVTILLVQNGTAAAVAGNAYFYNAAGSLLHTQVLVLPPQGTLVLNTAGIGSLVGQSGSATIAHTGPYGALAGKGVALEPATGFTFDTALTPVPQ